MGTAVKLHLFLNCASDVRGQLHKPVTTIKEAMCIPQPGCTFWGRDTFLAPAWDQTTVFGFSVHCPVKILAMLSLSSEQVKIVWTHSYSHRLFLGAELSTWTSFPLPLLERHLVVQSAVDQMDLNSLIKHVININKTRGAVLVTSNEKTSTYMFIFSDQ